jgi:hypothetical protein
VDENRSLYDRRTLRYPSDLTYEEWALIEPPPRKPPSDPLAKSWDIAYRIFCEGNYRQTETLDEDDQRSVRLPRRSLPFSSSFLNVFLRPKSTVRVGDQSEVDGYSFIAKLSIVLTSGVRASALL